MTIKTILVRSLSSKYRRTEDGVCILDPDATLEVHQGEQSVGRQPSYYRAAEINISDVQVDPPPHIVAQASVSKPIVNASLAAVSGDPQVTALSPFAAPQLQPSRLNILARMTPSQIDDEGLPSILVGLADLDSGDYIGAGILGEVRGGQATPVYGASCEIAAAGIDAKSFIAAATVPRVVDTSRLVRAEIKGNGINAFTFIAAIVDGDTGLDLNPGGAFTISAVTAEKVAHMQEFLAKAVPAVIILDGDGETGDTVQLDTLHIS